MIASIRNLRCEKDSTDLPQVHCLPCKIHYNGTANIADYFKPINVKESEGEMEVSFRGYPLNGKTIDVPESYQGFIFKEESPENVIVENTFKSINYWEWDKKPSKNDPFLSALDWLSISSKVHDPVEDLEDV